MKKTVMFLSLLMAVTLIQSCVVNRYSSSMSAASDSYGTMFEGRYVPQDMR